MILRGGSTGWGAQILYMVAASFSQRNGCLPVLSTYSKVPMAKTSTRRSIGSLFTCSGANVLTLPLTGRSWLAPPSTVALAMPKSTTLVTTSKVTSTFCGETSRCKRPRADRSILELVRGVEAGAGLHRDPDGDRQRDAALGARLDQLVERDPSIHSITNRARRPVRRGPGSRPRAGGGLGSQRRFVEKLCSKSLSSLSFGSMVLIAKIF